MIKFLKYGFLSHIFLVISLFLIFASFIFRGSSYLQYEIVFVSLFLYLLTSAIHHYLDKSLTFEVVCEYLLIGLLSFLVVYGSV